MNAAHQVDDPFASPPRLQQLTPASGLKPGVFISHNIQLVRPLGSGGMGQVWLAEHIGLDTQVAVKFMWNELATDPLNVARFELEAKLAARIKSPHVVGILDYASTPDGVPFIVMELLQGRDLESWLGSGGKLSLEDTTRVLIQLCKALAKAHVLGVVHRDIKAENLFLAESEGDIFVKVLDFGVAKDQEQLPITVSGTTVGTPSYMSPEQLFHPMEVDLRTDLWSTAVLVYRCLTGQFPFGGDAFPSVCLAVSKGTFSSPSALNKELPAGLDAWFKKAFHRSQDHRFQSATEMGEAFLTELRRAGLLPGVAPSRDARSSLPSYTIDLEGISERPLSLCRPRRKNRSKLGVAALVASAALGGLLALPDHGAVWDSAAALADRASGWAIAQSGFIELNPTDEAPPQDHGTLSEFVVSTASAFAERDIPREEDLPKATPEVKRPASPSATQAAHAPPSFVEQLPDTDSQSLNVATIRFGL